MNEKETFFSGPITFDEAAKFAVVEGSRLKFGCVDESISWWRGIKGYAS
jgi:hypothetical protein